MLATTKNLFDSLNRGERQIAGVLWEEQAQARTPDGLAGLNVAAAIRRARVEPAYRAELETRLAWRRWELEVLGEMEDAVQVEAAAAELLWGRTCAECGSTIPVEYVGRERSFPCYCWELAEAEYAMEYGEE